MTKISDWVSNVPNKTADRRMKSILDKSFQYVPSSETDLAKKFAQIGMEQRGMIEAIEADKANVLSLQQHLAKRDRIAAASSR